MRKIFNYIKYSNFKISFDFNPFVWSFRYFYQGPSDEDPNLSIRYLRILPLSINLVIDDGTYYIIQETKIDESEFINEVPESENPYK